MKLSPIIVFVSALLTLIVLNAIEAFVSPFIAGVVGLVAFFWSKGCIKSAN